MRGGQERRPTSQQRQKRCALRRLTYDVLFSRTARFQTFNILHTVLWKDTLLDLVWCIARRSNVWLIWLLLYSTSQCACSYNSNWQYHSTYWMAGILLHVSSKIGCVVYELRFHVAGKPSTCIYSTTEIRTKHKGGSFWRTYHTSSTYTIHKSSWTVRVVRSYVITTSWCYRY